MDDYEGENMNFLHPIQIENGLVEAVALLISQMPCMRPYLSAEKLGESYQTKPEFMKAWEKWRAQITKLDCSAFWLQCGHQKTRDGLKIMLQIMLENASILSNVTYHWLELYISHFLYVRPFTVVSVTFMILFLNFFFQALNLVSVCLASLFSIISPCSFKKMAYFFMDTFYPSIFFYLRFFWVIFMYLRILNYEHIYFFDLVSWMQPPSQWLCT
ncbi:hypothetical protein ACJIZ3_019574 [Penstemon smallii]|uniref:Nuclear pore complex protein Nup85 n=1 Tax=Penstemon smallii TaxID=265156 RepID=A0ABD3T1Q2_9LAMI